MLTCRVNIPAARPPACLPACLPAYVTAARDGPRRVDQIQFDLAQFVGFELVEGD